MVWSKSVLSLGWVCILGLLVGGGFAGAALPAAAAGPLRVLSANPRYFTDGSGRAVYLTGSHTWNTVQDFSNGTPLPGGSFSGYLDWLQRYNLNFIRFWMVEHAWDAEGGSRIAPLPWARPGPESALDGEPTFDLTRFDEAYFSRLRQRAAAAGDRGFYVSIMLFDDWSTENPGPWQGHPFNVHNNINGVTGDPHNDGTGLAFHQWPGVTQRPAQGVAQTVWDFQTAYVRKVIDTVNDLDNVLYEIANETGISRDWQYNLIAYIKRYESGLPKQHPVLMSVGWPVLTVDNAALFTSAAEAIAPNEEGGYLDDPPPATGAKVIVADTDHLSPGWVDRADWIWKTFTRGLNPIYMDDMSSGGGREETRRAMGYTRMYADKMHLRAMTPRGELTSTAYALANPGAEYLVYQPDSGTSFTVNLDAARYTYEWFDPAAGRVAATGTLAASGGPESFRAPFDGPAVLYLKVVRGTTDEPPG